MPLYEFSCSRCAESFEELVSRDAAAPACPICARNDEVSHVPLAKLTITKKENLRPPNIKGMVKPRYRS